MPTQLHMRVLPAGAHEINAVVAMIQQGEQVAYFASGVPVFVHGENDAVGRRVAAAQLLALGLARQDELSAALGVNRTTLDRQQRKVEAHGVLGVVDGKRGPRGPHRFTADKRERVEALLQAGISIRQAAQQVGVTEGTIRHAVRRGELRRAAARLPRPQLGPRARSERDARAEGGVAVQRHTERALARLGHLTEAAPRFVAAEAVRSPSATFWLCSLGSGETAMISTPARSASDSCVPSPWSSAMQMVTSSRGSPRAIPAGRPHRAVRSRAAARPPAAPSGRPAPARRRS